MGHMQALKVLQKACWFMKEQCEIKYMYLNIWSNGNSVVMLSTEKLTSTLGGFHGRHGGYSGNPFDSKLLGAVRVQIESFFIRKKVCPSPSPLIYILVPQLRDKYDLVAVFGFQDGVRGEWRGRAGTSMCKMVGEDRLEKELRSFLMEQIRY